MAKNPRIDRDWREPIRKSMVGTDYGISLARIQWDFFATLTFAGNVPKPKIAYGLAFSWLRELAVVSGVPYKRLLIALRGEEGEANGRFHFHCLIGGTTTRNYHSWQHKAEYLWKIRAGGARVDVRQYDRSLAGTEYVCKCLGANAYELNKYSFANTVTLSSSVISLIRGIDESGDRRCGRDT
jgi:hypothetical protein